MADLSLTTSGYQTGSTDTWTNAVENVTPHKAAHVNGLASGILQIEAVLGSGSSLPGTLASLAARLAVQVGTDGIIIPPGAGMDFYGSSAPTGWLFCDGSAVSRTTYSALFTAIGTTYGAGDGSTTFNLPDKRNRVSRGAGTGVGAGSSGTGAPSGTAFTARSLGQWGGDDTHLLTAAESGLRGHDHGLTQTIATDIVGTSNAFAAGSTLGNNIFALDINAVTDEDATSAHSIADPYLICNHIIKT